MKRIDLLKAAVLLVVVLSYPALMCLGQEAAATLRPDQCVPSHTIAYAEVPDFEASKARFEETALYKIWQEPEVQTFVLPIKDFIAKRFNTFKEEFTKESGLPFDEIYSAFSGQIAIALITVNPPGPAGPDGQEKAARPDVVEAALFLTPREPDRVKALSEALLPYFMKKEKSARTAKATYDNIAVTELFNEDKPSDPTLAYCWLGNTFVLTIGPRGDTMKGVISRWRGQEQDSLSRNESFAATRDRVNMGNADFVAYVNTGEVLRKVDPYIPANVRAPLEASGVYSIKSAAYKLRFDGPAFRDTIYVHTGAEKQGFVAALSPAPLDENVLDLVPAEATTCLATRFNPNLLWQTIDTFARSFGEEKYGAFRAAVEKATVFLEVDIEKEIIPAFGNYAVIYSQPSQMGPMLFGLLDWVAIVQLQDKTKAQMAGELLRQKTTEFALEQAQKRGNAAVPFYWQSLPQGDVTLHYVTIPESPNPMLTPGYAVNGDKLVVALTLQNLQAALGRMKETVPGIRTRPDFAMVYAKAPKGAGLIGYTDTKANFPQTHAMLSTVLGFAVRGINAQTAENGIFIDVTKFPPPEVFMKHLFGSILIVKGEENGIVVESYSPGNTAVIPVVAIGAAVAIPSLLRARGAARTTQCTSNLKQIGLAAMMYANDFDQKLPQDLQALYPKYLSSKQILKCATDPNPKKEKLRADNTEIEVSYTYIHIPEGLTAPGIQPSETMICFDSEPRHRGRRNVLFADGHVESLTEEMFQQKLAAQKWKPAE